MSADPRSGVESIPCGWADGRCHCPEACEKVGHCMATGAPSAATGLAPLDTAGVLWVAAIDRVPIEERVEWVKKMKARVAEINAARAVYDGDPPGAGWQE